MFLLLPQETTPRILHPTTVIMYSRCVSIHLFLFAVSKKNSLNVVNTYFLFAEMKKLCVLIKAKCNKVLNHDVHVTLTSSEEMKTSDLCGATRRLVNVPQMNT